MTTPATQDQDQTRQAQAQNRENGKPAPKEDDALLIERPLPPCSIVIFGATGDLTHRKLLPALFSIEAQGLLPEKLKIVAFARRDFTDDSFREEVHGSLQEFAGDLWKEAQDVWPRFSQAHRLPPLGL